MKRVENVYKSSNYVPNQQAPTFGETPFAETHFGEVKQSAFANITSSFGELADDVTKVGGALATFPYNSAFKLVGLAAMVYIGFNVVKKFVNMEETITKLMRGR